MPTASRLAQSWHSWLWAALLLTVAAPLATATPSSPATAATQAGSTTRSVTDDAGYRIMLATPARRIVSLAPHITELLYAAGAGAQVVGVSEFSDYPPPATQIRRIGSAAALDLEGIIMLRPDLVVAWSSGNSAAQVARLKKLGIAVFESEPRDFAAIASNIERLARLAGTEAEGRKAASAFLSRLDTLTEKHAKKATMRVFYQIWDKPLMTLNGKHMASAVMRLCGGRNIFENLPQIAPTVGAEDVVRANPDVIIGGTAEQHNAASGWQRFPAMTAVADGNLFELDPDLLTRPGPRVVDGAQQMCRLLEAARAKRR